MHGQNGKSYDLNGNLIFIGEFVNGKSGLGWGRQFSQSGVLVYEGGYLNYMKHGKNCKVYQAAGGWCKNIVDFYNDEMNGYGKEFTIHRGLNFTGYYLNGRKQRHGGREYSNNTGKLVQETNTGYHNKNKLMVRYDKTGYIIDIISRF